MTKQTPPILEEVLKERDKQDKKWGLQNHEPKTWMLILQEETGECAKEILEAIPKRGNWTEQKKHYQNLEEELIQVAAVAVAMIESLRRNELSES